jgi:hypothetical protein
MKRISLLISALFLFNILFSQDYLARVRKEKQWGCIHTDGSWAINPQFEHIHDFYEGLAAVQKNGEWGFVDGKGTWIINLQFPNAFPFVKVGN